MPRKTRSRRSTRRTRRVSGGGAILDGIAAFLFGSEKKNTVPTSTNMPSANVQASVPSTMGGKRKSRKSRKSRKVRKSRKASRKH